MAIIHCPGCGEDVSDGAPYCPRCRYPVLEMCSAETNIEEVGGFNKKVPLFFRICLAVGIFGGLLGVGLRYQSTSLLFTTLSLLGFLVGAGGVVYHRFRWRSFFRDREEPDDLDM